MITLGVRSTTNMKIHANVSAWKMAGIGVDNIDIDACSANGVVVMNTPFGNAITTAEHAIAMMFSLARQIPAADQTTQAGMWEKSRFMGTELTGKTLGIIGCGQLSQMLGEAANRQGMSVAFLCLDEIPVVQGLGPIFEASELEAFLKVCDAVTVERESIDDAILQRVRDTVGLAPRYEALVVLRERDTQKAMLDSLKIPTSPWFCASNTQELLSGMAAAPQSALRCKRTLGGYDGGGQWRVTSPEDCADIPKDGFPVIAEAEIAIAVSYTHLTLPTICSV